ncbi:MAG: AmmeMemoRadiSam system radical SAM enzyme, partial [Candidatus Krumholzibacteria bacterium]|nr:AmmeMemoRadiSam system radical SAM enzyme [Candidatus Krumholzibacteria bacterium]
ARGIARERGLRYVYVGNVHDEAGSSTYCPRCEAQVVGRDWYRLTAWNVDAAGRCASCGERLPGHFEAQPGAWGPRRQIVDLRAFRA